MKDQQMETVIRTDANPRDFLFGTSRDNPRDRYWTWDTSLLPDVLDKKSLLVAVPPELAAGSPLAHALCNSMEVFLNEIGEASQLDRSYLKGLHSFPNCTLAEAVHVMHKHGVSSHAGDRPIKKVTRYERIEYDNMLAGLRVALFCNLIPVIAFWIGPEFKPLKNKPYLEQATYLGGKTVGGRDTYCASVVGVNLTDKYLVCASAEGYEFGANGFFALSFDYVTANVFDAFVIREVNDIRAIIPEELYVRISTTEIAAVSMHNSTTGSPTTLKSTSSWRKMLGGLFFKDG